VALPSPEGNSGAIVKAAAGKVAVALTKPHGKTGMLFVLVKK
jgi:hypothetical protein